ncbi:MAG: hypothetical protein QX198_10685 [Methylococcaceae bacterium]
MIVSQNKLLTHTPLAAILYLLSPHVIVGLGLPEIHGANRHKRGFFMRKISALHNIMSGWAGSRKAGRVVCPVVQPVQSGTMIGLMLSGLKPFIHEMQS